MVVQYWRQAREIYAAQHFKEFYSRVFSGKISPFVAAACVGTPVTPNHLTALMVPVGIAGGIFQGLGTPAGFVIGGLLFVLVNILDAADGELARYTGRTSDFGDYLDRIAHYMTNTAIVVGLGIGLFMQTGHLYLLPLMFVANSAIIGDDAMRDLLVTCGLQESPGGTEARKALKSETRMSFGKIGAIVSILSSNVAMFHLSTLFAIIQMILTNIPFLEVYFVFVATVTIAKFLVRAWKIRLHYA